MKSFYEYLTEDQNTIHFFDLDETLFSHGPRVKIKVVKNGKVVKKLTNKAFNAYTRKKGERLDFSDFRSAKKFEQSAKPIPEIIKVLQRLQKNNNVEIMTARADFDDKNHFGGVLHKHGIDIKTVHVRRAGNIEKGSNPAEKKALFIDRLIKRNKYKEVHLYDDSMHNLDAFLKLKKAHPKVRFYGHHVIQAAGNVKIVNV